MRITARLWERSTTAADPALKAAATREIAVVRGDDQPTVRTAPHHARTVTATDRLAGLRQRLPNHGPRRRRPPDRRPRPAARAPPRRLNRTIGRPGRARHSHQRRSPPPARGGNGVRPAPVSAGHYRPVSIARPRSRKTGSTTLTNPLAMQGRNRPHGVAQSGRPGGQKAKGDRMAQGRR